MTKAPDGRRKLPSVDALLTREELETLLRDMPRVMVRRAVREILDEEREGWRHRLESDPDAEVAAPDTLLARVIERSRAIGGAGLRRIVNATGVVVHTNLGRSPLAEEACEAVVAAARGYSTLEYDLAAGRRGSRLATLRELLVELTGAEDALVVNNNAAALVLALTGLAAGREVIVSRGELVEIGGSFRLPDIMQRSGARLVEVGTTNKTKPDDYRQAISAETAMLLKVHRSNFSLRGFVAEVELPELVEIGSEHGIPVVEDLGSGALVDLTQLGIAPEPTVQASLKAGAQLVTFSGDKLLGGPQAGVLVGEGQMIQRLARDPMARALRLDKMTIAALESTLRIYLDPERARTELPTLRLLSRPAGELEQAARRLATLIEAHWAGLETAVVETTCQVGGGAQPDARIDSWGVALRPPAPWSAQELGDALRRTDPPVIGRIEADRLILDLRTVLEGEAELIAEALGAAGAASPG